MSTINHPNKLKLHDSFIIDMDETTWHGVRSRRPQMELSECETDELVSKIRDYLSKDLKGAIEKAYQKVQKINFQTNWSKVGRTV